MIDPTHLDERLLAHTKRVARVNRDGWMLEASAPAGGRGRHRFEPLLALCRRAGSVVRLVRRPELAERGTVSTAQ